MTRKMPDPVPPEWLPDPVAAPDGSDEAQWEERLQRLMSAAEPALAELARSAGPARASRGAAVAPWWSALLGHWRPALAGAALAAAGLVLGVRIAPAPPAAEPSASAFTLTAVAGDGEAAAVWQGLGGEADPVLAELVLQGGSQ